MVLNFPVVSSASLQHPDLGSAPNNETLTVPKGHLGTFFNQSHLTPEAVGLRLCPSSQHCDTSGPTQSRGPNTITLQALVINAVIMFMRTRCDPMLQGVCVKPALTRFSILAPLHHCGRPNAGVPSSFLETQGNECL